jgi:hypothetical protein
MISLSFDVHSGIYSIGKEVDIARSDVLILSQMQLPRCHVICTADDIGVIGSNPAVMEALCTAFALLQKLECAAWPNEAVAGDKRRVIDIIHFLNAAS